MWVCTVHRTTIQIHKRIWVRWTSVTRIHVVLQVATINLPAFTSTFVWCASCIHCISPLRGVRIKTSTLLLLFVWIIHLFNWLLLCNDWISIEKFENIFSKCENTFMLENNRLHINVTAGRKFEFERLSENYIRVNDIDGIVSSFCF